MNLKDFAIRAIDEAEAAYAAGRLKEAKRILLVLQDAIVEQLRNLDKEMRK